MRILTRMCTSLDGCVTTPDGWPVQLAFRGWDAGALGFYELQARCDAVIIDDDPVRLLGRLRTSNTGGDVHLVGGPETSETFRVIGVRRGDLSPRSRSSPVRGAGSPRTSAGCSLTLVDVKTWPGGVAAHVPPSDSAATTGDDEAWS